MSNSRPSDRAIATPLMVERAHDYLLESGVRNVSKYDVKCAIECALRAAELDASGLQGAEPVAWQARFVTRDTDYTEGWWNFESAATRDAKAAEWRGYGDTVETRDLYTRPPVESAPGFVLVPVEPTLEMQRAATKYQYGPGGPNYDHVGRWKAMLAAAPAAGGGNAVVPSTDA